MNKAKKAVWVFAIITAIIISILWIIAQNAQSRINIPDDKIIFYYGVSCPHCKIVEEFMGENNAADFLNIEMKEVYLNKNNANELIEVGKLCDIETGYIGAVPLTYFNGSCYLGDEPSIEFLKEKLAEVSE